MRPGPLKGRAILVTRALDQAGPLVDALASRGAEVMEAPVIALADPEDWRPADEAIAHLDSYDWVVFTSANAVERFLERVARLGRSAGLLARARVAAIGSATAGKLREGGIQIACVPDDFRAEGLLQALGRLESPTGTRVLIPRAAVAREILPESLRAQGARVDVVAIYQTIPVPVAPSVVARLRAGGIDMVTFASASALRHLLRAVGGAPALEGVALAVIGPVTAAAARECGLDPCVIAARSTVESLAEAIAAHYQPRGPAVPQPR